MLRKLFNYHHRHGSGRERWLRKLTRKLKLDSHQQAHLIALQSNWMKAQAELEQVRADRNEMLAAMLSSRALDQQETQQLLRIPQCVMDEHLPSVVEDFRTFHASLDDAQREQLGLLWQKYQRHDCFIHH